MSSNVLQQVTIIKSVSLLLVLRFRFYFLVCKSYYKMIISLNYVCHRRVLHQGVEQLREMEVDGEFSVTCLVMTCFQESSTSFCSRHPVQIVSKCRLVLWVDSLMAATCPVLSSHPTSCQSCVIA